MKRRAGVVQTPTKTNISNTDITGIANKRFDDTLSNDGHDMINDEARELFVDTVGQEHDR